jgi:hypothetical protein
VVVEGLQAVVVVLLEQAFCGDSGANDEHSFVKSMTVYWRRTML